MQELTQLLTVTGPFCTFYQSPNSDPAFTDFTADAGSIFNTETGDVTASDYLDIFDLTKIGTSKLKIQWYSENTMLGYFWVVTDKDLIEYRISPKDVQNAASLNDDGEILRGIFNEFLIKHPRPTRLFTTAGESLDLELKLSNTSKYLIYSSDTRISRPDLTLLRFIFSVDK